MKKYIFGVLKIKLKITVNLEIITENEIIFKQLCCLSERLHDTV